jgi:SAM-dependent methyltransferase
MRTALPPYAPCPRHDDGQCACERGAEDAAFDAVYPLAIQALSRRFWTPVAVARRAAQLFERAGARTVLDVGSGVGKFGLVAAAAAPGVTFVGIEQRRHLVEMARSAQQRLRVSNAFFLVGDATTTFWRGFQGFYFFNPLAENLFGRFDRIDDAAELSQSRFYRDVVRVERALRAAPLETAVVTYHGLSGRMPACFELAHNEPAGSDWLRLWVKTRERADGFFLELGEGGVLHRPDDGSGG